LAATLAARSSARRVDVLVAARDLQPGSPIGQADLRVTRVSPDTNARFVAATDAAQVLGRVPRGFIPAGTPINSAMVAAGPEVPSGNMVVGAVLSPGQVPVALATGDTVEVLITARGGGVTSSGSASGAAPQRADGGRAVVFAVSQLGQDANDPAGSTWVSLEASDTVAATIAQAAADGTLRLAAVGAP
jgi:Flp pilus assembly protein CpaB